MSVITQRELVLEYFKKRPNQVIIHKNAKKELEAEYLRRTGNRFEDPDRQIRSLYDEGLLKKIGNGKYLYDPSHNGKVTLHDFSASVKKQALRRDGYKCVVCGLGKDDGIQLHVDHLTPRSRGGQATLENAQTLCASHNFLKKDFNQLELGKRMFIALRAKALKSPKSEESKHLLKFCTDVISLYEKYGIDSHLN